ncbi:hypothetical protein LXA43DRAFT_341851 [Ganoderma leucocontextum]|nr:hypothetical protein LXA43DRAFT_341851 [Ganoderma leucocontextum]
MRSLRPRNLGQHQHLLLFTWSLTLCFPAHWVFFLPLAPDPNLRRCPAAGSANGFALLGNKTRAMLHSSAIHSLPSGSDRPSLTSLSVQVLPIMSRPTPTHSVIFLRLPACIAPYRFPPHSPYTGQAFPYSVASWLAGPREPDDDHQSASPTRPSLIFVSFRALHLVPFVRPR